MIMREGLNYEDMDMNGVEFVMMDGDSRRLLSFAGYKKDPMYRVLLKK